jgi:hypothetical protein
MLTLPIQFEAVEHNIINEIRALGTFDMDSDIRNIYSKNKTTLEEMYNRSKAIPPSGGCYIATMVYGDYNHPQVKVLRDFKENVLSHFYLGRKVIQFYYR